MSNVRFLGVAVLTAATLAAFACGSSEDDPGTPPGEDGGGGDGSSGGDGAPPVPSEFGLDTRPANPTCKAPARPPSNAPIAFEEVYAAVNLGIPMMIAQAPGNRNKWFVAQRNGNLVSFNVTAPVAAPANVGNLATACGGAVGQGGEGGFLGFAFHPAFATNGKIYATWTQTSGAPGGFDSIVSELHSPDGGVSIDACKTILGPFPQPASNHNGGGIAFGKDGFLYLTFGDGGGGDDPFLNGQKKTGFFSKLLRIDVDNPAGGLQYGIPNGNPWKGMDPGTNEPATFAYGLRNPFRFSVDRETNEPWLGEVGQNKWEEVILAKAGGNYGWPCREGAHDYITTGAKCPSMSNLLDPVVEVEHIPANTRSITGGVVYRGKAIPGFVGSYVFGDFESQEIFVVSFDTTTGEAKLTKVDDAPANPWVSFGEDLDGEVYATAFNGTMWKIIPKPGAPASTFPDRLSKTGCTDPADVKKPASGLIPYGVRTPLWSDGAEKERWMALPDGSKITVGADGDFDFPKGTVLVKTFTIGGKKIETRLFVRHDDDGWAGYTYEWLDDQSDAVLLLGSKQKTVGTQSWHFPSRSECVRCHTAAAGRSLGLELGQQNGDHVYPSTNRISNQLKTLDHIGMFAAPLGKPVDQILAYPDPLGAAPLEQRARSYLHANCSNCHRKDGGGRGNMVLTYGTSFKDTVTCNVDPEAGDIGVAGGKLIVPGQPAQSILSRRPHDLGANRMPPLASSIVDDKGVKVIDDWITSLTACPP